MGLPREDIETAIVYPLGSLVLYLLVWKIISGMSCCLLGLPDRVVNAAVVTMVHISSLQRMSPHSGEFIPTPWHIEIAVLFSASYYLKTAFGSESKTDIAFNLMITLSLLDLTTLKSGGDLGVYFLFLLEVPNFLSLYMAPFLRSEACFEFIYTLIYVAFRICLLGHLTFLIIMNRGISEDVKMNLSILFLFSFTCFPAMLLTCYRACAGSVAAFISNLPKPNHHRKRPVCKQ